MNSQSSARAEAVLVCGLGALGRQCVQALRSYRVPVRAIDASPIDHAEVENTPIVCGDCRYVEVLRRAGIDLCRAILLVTGDPHANIEAALAARKINPTIRIVARVAEQNLNALLGSVLGNFTGFEPKRLAAGALALAALQSETIGYFHLGGRLLHVRRHEAAPGDPWVGMRVEQIDSHGHVVLEHTPKGMIGGAEESGAPEDAAEGPFHRYDPGTVVAAGDVLTVLSGASTAPGAGTTFFLPGAPAGEEPPHMRWAAGVRPKPSDFLAMIRQGLTRTSGVVVGALVVLVLAVALAMLLFPRADDSLSAADAFFTALVLMTGGTYADLFPAFHHLSNAIRLFSIVLSVIGTVAVGLLYAWFTERLMTLRLRLVPRRPRPPERDHVVIVGLGGVGRAAATLLDELGRAAVGIEPHDLLEQHALPHLAVVKGSGTNVESLREAKLGEARGLLAATDNDWMNLEIALLARKLNPGCAVVIRTKDTRFSDNVNDLVPGLRVLCIPVIAASAFAAAALGENVIDLFQLRRTTIFVVEYRIEADDALRGSTLAEVAEGYAVVPILHARQDHDARFCSASDGSIRLQLGDRLAVLGSARSLQHIERGHMLPRSGALTLVDLRPYADRLVLAALLVQKLGYSLEHAQEMLASLPRALPERLYPQQAQRLSLALERAGATVELFWDSEAPRWSVLPSGSTVI